MLSKEEVADVISYCKEHGCSYKERLAELGIPEWKFYDSKYKYAIRERKEFDKGRFLQLRTGSDGSMTPFPDRFPLCLQYFTWSKRIWHYYTLPKFLSLLSKSSLYMCRQDKFDDSFEGVMTNKDVAFFESKVPGITNRMKGDSLGCTYSNCWTLSEVDEYVLWSTYASLTDGVIRISLKSCWISLILRKK